MSKTTIILTVLVFLLALIPQLWFPGKTLLLGYDNVYPLNPIAFLQDRIFSWTATQGFEVDQSAIQGSLVIHFVDSLPLLFGLPPQVAQRIITSLWFFLLLLSPFLFIKTLEKNGFITNPYIKFYFPVLYAVNFYILQAWWIFERTKFSLLVATPLILAILVPLIKQKQTVRRSFIAAILCAFVLTVFNGGGWAGISLFGGLLAALGSLFVVFTAVFFRQRRLKELLYFYAIFPLLGVFFFLFNAYFLVPFLATTFQEYGALLSRSGGLGGVIGWTRYISEHTSFINLLRLQGIPDWYNTLYHPYAPYYFQNPTLIIVSFLFPVLLLLGIKANSNNKFSIFFFFTLILVSLFLTAGTHMPLGRIFEFIMLHVPGFVIFRSAFFKFGYAYWLASSFFIAAGLGLVTVWLSERVDRAKLVSFPSGGIVAGLLIILLVCYHFPYLKGDFFRVDRSLDIGSRVEVPEYVPEFAKWWEENGTGERVLLLPRLNENWYFELYDWRYLSLNPVLANYGTRGTIENAVLLTSDERKLLNFLYDAINAEDRRALNILTDLFGIEYFLVRGDFSYSSQGRETDSPREISEKLKAFPDVRKVRNFGRWELYKIAGNKPVFYVQTAAVVSPTNEDAFRFTAERPLQLSQSEGIDPALIDSTVIYPTCVSCQGEREQVPVVFPKPKILLGSNVYELLQVRERFQAPPVLSFDEQVYKDVGESLKYAGQITEIIKGDKGDSLINLAREKYIASLDGLSQKTQSILTQSANPYSMISILRQYLDAEKKYLEELTLQINRKEQQANLELVLEKISKVQEQLDTLFSEQDINRKKVYDFSVAEPGVYKVALSKNSLGNINPDDIADIRLVLTGSQASFPPKVLEEFLDFGEISLPAGKQKITILFPLQQSVLSEPRIEKHAGKTCFSSYINGYKKGKVYQVEYEVKNNFDPNLFFFVDDATEYAPKLLEYFSVSGEQVLSKKYVVSEQTVPRDKTATTLRVAFCAPSLTRELYARNVRLLQMRELTSPIISLVKTYDQPAGISPEISIKRENATSYLLEVKNAKNPFFLVHSSRYSPGWNATTGTHLVGNGFQNVWYIDKQGSYRVEISYSPQQYVYIGMVISIFSLIGGVLLYGIFTGVLRKNAKKI